MCFCLHFWGLDDLSDVIAGKVILTHLYPYIILNRSSVSSALIIYRRLGCTEINNIVIYGCKFPKNIYYGNVSAQITLSVKYMAMEMYGCQWGKKTYLSSYMMDALNQYYKSKCFKVKPP